MSKKAAGIVLRVVEKMNCPIKGAEVFRTRAHLDTAEF
jgi:hypothetical protein